MSTRPTAPRRPSARGVRIRTVSSRRARRAPRRSVRHPGRRIALVLAAIVATAVVVVAGLRLAHVARHLQRARASLEAAATEIANANLASAQQRVAAAESDLVVANDRLHASPDLLVLDIIPVARQNLQAIRRSVALGLRMTDAGYELLRTAAPLVGPTGRAEVSLSNGSAPVQIAASLQREMSELAPALPSPKHRPPTSWLFGPVAKLQRDVFRQAYVRRQQFASLQPALYLLSDMGGVNGPRRYLLAVANEAEMRGTGGMILSYGVLAAANGTFTLEHFGPIDELALKSPVHVDVPPDYYNQYEPKSPTGLWRSANFTADFGVAGPVMEEMYRAATGTGVDGVVQLDSTGLAAILAGIGPVDVPGVGVVAADNVESVSLNQVYTAFPDRAVRQDALGDIAEAVFRRLVTGQFSTVRPLAQALTAAVAQRHVIVHTTHALAERSVVSLGADGAMPDPRASFADMTVQNVSGNKLDYYVDTSLRLSGRWDRGARGRLHAQVEVSNTAPVGGRPQYVFGPNPELPGTTAGTYHGWVTVYLPFATRLAASRGDSENPPYAATEGDRTAIHFVVIVPAGQRKVVDFDVVLAARVSRDLYLELVPVPRLRPTSVSVDLRDDRKAIHMTGTLTKVMVLRAR